MDIFTPLRIIKIYVSYGSTKIACYVAEAKRTKTTRLDVIAVIST